MLCEEKLEQSYLDNSINLHSDEKSEQLEMVLAALGPSSNVSILEIGPGGGAALDGLAETYKSRGLDMRGIDFTLLELFDSKSISLGEAVRKVQGIGATVLQCLGDATDIPSANSSYDVVNCSAVLHEVFSYAGGLSGINRAVEEFGRVTKEGGTLLYRDIYPVDVSLTLPVEQAFERDSWKQFAYFFLPYFLDGETHLYKDFQLSNDIEYSATHKLSLELPAGLARELQRHYITFRDHMVRSGSLGLRVDPERYDETEWARTDSGFEKKVYINGDEEEHENGYRKDRTGLFLPASEFDDLIDERLAIFLSDYTSNKCASAGIMDQWLMREGRESYIYKTSSDMVDTVCQTNTETGRFIVAHARDFQVRQRDFYTQYLQRVLGEYAFPDSKLMINFTRV